MYTYNFLQKLKIKNKMWKPFKTVDRLTDVCYPCFVANYSCLFTSIKHSGDYFTAKFWH